MEQLSSTDIAALWDDVSESEEPGVFESNDDGVESEEPKREVRLYTAAYYVLHTNAAINILLNTKGWQRGPFVR